MAGTEPLNEDGSPHIAKLEVEQEMEDKMVQIKKISAQMLLNADVSPIAKLILAWFNPKMFSPNPSIDCRHCFEFFSVPVFTTKEMNL